jgi:hypothetical protein
MIKLEAFAGALKRSFPRMNAGAPTEKGTLRETALALRRVSAVGARGHGMPCPYCPL